MKPTILTAVEERFHYYRKKYRSHPTDKASDYAKNWAYGIYRWTFGEEPPTKWKSEVEERVRSLQSREPELAHEETTLDQFTS